MSANDENLKPVTLWNFHAMSQITFNEFLVYDNQQLKFCEPCYQFHIFVGINPKPVLKGASKGTIW